MFVDNFLAVPGSQYQGGIVDAVQNNFDPGLRRPYLNKNSVPCVTANTGRWTVEKGERRPIRQQVPIHNLLNNPRTSATAVKILTNATALRKEEWLELDRVVLRAARYRLRAVADLAAANSFGGFNGMSKMILEHETMSDPGEAIVDMDGLTEGRTDSPQFQLQGLPLPITHSDFWFDARRLSISRNTGTPLDTTMGEAAGRRIAETLEKTLIGNQTGVLYGGASTQQGGYGRASQVYGYLTFPARLTNNSLYRPTGSGRSGTGWVPADTLKDVLACLDQLKLNKFFGPFMIYHSNDWDQYLDNDYFLTSTATNTPISSQTLRNRLRSIEGVQDVKRLDFLFAATPSTTRGPGGENLNGTYPFTLIFVQMTPDVARQVNGMDITTVQWESVGGMRLNFKVMTIQVPQIRADFYGNAGILQGTATL